MTQNILSFFNRKISISDIWFFILEHQKDSLMVSRVCKSGNKIGDYHRDMNADYFEK